MQKKACAMYFSVYELSNVIKMFYSVAYLTLALTAIGWHAVFLSGFN